MASSAARAPLGVFDSGLGGLSIVRALREMLPAEAIHYLADSVHCPYGARPEDEIRALSRGIVRYLLDQSCKLIVVACNTASAAALEDLRETFPQVPIVGMVPAVKVAAELTHTGVIGVLATPNTLDGALYQDVVAHHASGARVIAHACPDLVELVEAGALDGPETVAHLAESTRGMMAAGVDTIVLGCTHYPFLMPTLQRIVGPAVRLVEPSEAIARRVAYLLDRDGLASCCLAGVPLRCGVTGDPATFAARMALLMGQAAPVEALAWRKGRLGLAV